MHVHLTAYEWYLIDRYSGLAILAGAAWLSRQAWLPHRHTGYVSVGGYVRACRRCGRLPAGTLRTGFHGTEPEDSSAARAYAKAEHDYCQRSSDQS